MAFFGLFKPKKSKAQKKKERDLRNLQRYNEQQEKIDNDIKAATQVYKKKSIINSLKFETYTKRLVAIIVLAGLLDLQLTYVLAFMGKDQIVESLSGQICATILGTALIYMIRAYFDTKAEKKNDQPRVDRMFANDIINKVQDIVNASNIPAEQDAIKEGIPKEIMAVINNNSYDNDDDDDDGGEEIPCDSQSSESQAGDDA
jgi:hypothetical protein